MGRGSRASKGRGPTRRERRDAARTEKTTPAPKSDGSKVQPQGWRGSLRQRTAGGVPLRIGARRVVRLVCTVTQRVLRARALHYTALTLAALVTLAIGVGWWLAHQPPSWWEEVDTASAQIISTSRDVENWAITTMTKGHDPGERWAVTLTEDDANTWLAVRLPMWIASERGSWPESVHRVRVRFTKDRLVIGADIREPGVDRPRVVAAALSVEVGATGIAQATIEWTQLNRLKLPGAAGVARLRSWIDHTSETDSLAAQAASLLRGDLTTDSLGWKLEDGRFITVHDIAFRDGEVRLTCSTAAAR